MFTRSSLIVSWCALACIVIACSSVAVTGRKQLNFIPDTEMNAMSFQQYDQFLKTNRLSTNREQADMIKRVGNRISAAVHQYMNDNKMGDRIKDFKWEFNLVESKDVNAWCMPGGKVVFYTGILPVCRNEAGVAVVMGHEVAHAIAEHGAERMSQQMLTQLGVGALSAALRDKPQETQALWMGAVGMGAQVGVLLPFSRTHETEADKLGLVFMAMAGYHPESAAPFWQRMAQLSGGQAPPELLSTHPSNETRIADITAYLPEALKYYKKQ
jgi:predicted Zn-dependent protease